MYKPYLISNFKTGLDIALEPWLSMDDAWPTLINGRVNKGVLEKRLGMSEFATMKHGSTAQDDTTITGIHTYLKRGMPKLLIMDTLRVNRYNPVDEEMTDITGDSDIFSGGASDFFQFANWRGIGYMVNNKDQIYQYSGSGDVSTFDVPLDAGETDNQLATCRYIFVMNDRLLLLDTVEKGDWIPNNLLYSAVNSAVFNTSGGGDISAPTQERIFVAGRVGKNIAVWFQNSLWEIRKTGDTTLPFKWERVQDTEGCRAPYSGVRFENGIAVIGETHILFYDGFRVKRINLMKARDILDSFNNTYILQTFGYHQKDKNRILFTFTSSDGTVPDRILEYNITENNWCVLKSEQTFFAQCFGSFNGQKVPTMAELDGVVASEGAAVSEITVDSRAILGTPQLYSLVGCRNSQVYKLDDGAYDGTDDASGKIEIDWQSSRWNPHSKEGRKASLGNIKFLVDNDDTASALISFYKNTLSTAYKTATLSCDGSGDKFWTTLHADGEVGSFHRIKISHTEKANRPRIHAIMPYFERAGYL